MAKWLGTGVVVLLMGSVPVAACGQAPGGDPKADFEAAVVGKPMVLRNFSADELVRYSWNGGRLRFDGDSFRGFLLLTAMKVTFAADRVTIDGMRHSGERRKKDGVLVPLPTAVPFQVVVTMEPAQYEVELGQLRAALFFDNVDVALASIPPQLAAFVPAREKGLLPPVRACGACSWVGTSQWEEVPSDGVQPPKLLKAQDAHFSEAAMRARISGKVSFVIVVTRSGKVGQLWMTRQAGAGLDEQAARAVVQDEYEPAKRGREPVALVIGRDVNFEIN